MSCPDADRRRLADAAHDVWDGDLLLFRRRSLVSVAGRGDYSHAAIAGWWRDTLMCVEVREWYGGRAVMLEGQLASTPHGIDVFRPRIGDAARGIAVRAMIGKTGKRYAWHKLLRAALLHLPVARFLFPPDTGRDPAAVSVLPEYCSEAVANAYHYATGSDPVPSLKDRYTEPNDLARTNFFERKFTLIA